MKLAKGPRPWSIWASCLCFLTVGVWYLWLGLSDLGPTKNLYGENYPFFEWSYDWAIVALSAEFTIALIPIVWIFGVARNFARWMVVIVAFWKLWPLVDHSIHLWRFVSGPSLDMIILMGLIGVSLALLFTPSANQWFKGGRFEDATIE